MRHSLPAFVSRIVASVALLAFLVAGGTFNHTFGSHDNHIHQGESTGDHHHAGSDSGNRSVSDLDTVHCGANLLALTCEIEADIPLVSEVLNSLEPHRVLSKAKTVDPPPPRSASLS